VAAYSSASPKLAVGSVLLTYYLLPWLGAVQSSFDAEPAFVLWNQLVPQVAPMLLQWGEPWTFLVLGSAYLVAQSTFLVAVMLDSFACTRTSPFF